MLLHARKVPVQELVLCLAVNAIALDSQQFESSWKREIFLNLHEFYLIFRKDCKKMTAHNKFPANYALVGHDRRSEFESSKLLTKRMLLVVLLLVLLFPFVLARLNISPFTVFLTEHFVEISRKHTESFNKLAEGLVKPTETLHEPDEPESPPSLDKQEEPMLHTKETLDEPNEPKSSLSLEKQEEDKPAETLDVFNEPESPRSLDKKKETVTEESLDEPNEPESSLSLEKQEEDKIAGTLDKPHEPDSTPSRDKQEETVVHTEEILDEPSEPELSSSLEKQEEHKSTETLDEPNEPESPPSLDKQEKDIDFKQQIDFSVGGCNIWKGEWIPHSSEPPYTNVSCQFIQGHQDCLKNGRPDLGYLYWKWKPYDCDLPLFDAKKFLKLVKGKALAFAGDSISRNHFQSLLCFLAQVEIPENLYRDEKDSTVRWFFPSYNFTLAVFWSPFLVEGTEDEVKGFPASYEKIYLDRVDNNWASSLSEYDYIVLSSGHWFLKSSVYFLKNEVIGCHYCPELNLTQVSFYFAFRTALRTAFDFLTSSNYHGVVFFRTFAPDHFENGQWQDGGNCMRTTPFRNATFGGVIEEMYNIQLEEFGRTLQFNRGIRARFKVVDTIHASLLRPDAHPGPYRNAEVLSLDKNARVPQDCLHWCLPGAIDTWSAMLLEIVRHV